ncbi:MAG: sel1 repeat family protein [Betaproteobacteria bacterium]|nr:sel1 repeat family protein [Betaproteobacteria bacterium]
MYTNGNGVNKDSAKAFEWYQKSAEQGNQQGQNSLGIMYYEAKEFLKALELYQRQLTKEMLLLRVI